MRDWQTGSRRARPVSFFVRPQEGRLVALDRCGGDQMTEAQWFACNDPRAMLKALDSKEWGAALVTFGRACLSAHRLPPTEGNGWTVRAVTPDVQVALLRCLVGNPFRRTTCSPDWRTDTALALARQIYESRDFGAMPILADALQDAGCDDTGILDHCRGSGPHVRGCWVVDLVLGKE
jgi:hypothetical protein